MEVLFRLAEVSSAGRVTQLHRVAAEVTEDFCEVLLLQVNLCERNCLSDVAISMWSCALTFTCCSAAVASWRYEFNLRDCLVDVVKHHWYCRNGGFMVLHMMEEFTAAKFASCCRDGENHIDICITCLCCLGPEGPLSAPLVCTAATDCTEITPEMTSSGSLGNAATCCAATGCIFVTVCFFVSRSLARRKYLITFLHLWVSNEQLKTPVLALAETVGRWSAQFGETCSNDSNNRLTW